MGSLLLYIKRGHIPWTLRRINGILISSANSKKRSNAQGRMILINHPGTTGEICCNELGFSHALIYWKKRWYIKFTFQEILDLRADKCVNKNAFSFNKMHFRLLSTKWWSFGFGHCVLIVSNWLLIRNRMNVLCIASIIWPSINILWHIYSNRHSIVFYQYEMSLIRLSFFSLTVYGCTLNFILYTYMHHHKYMHVSL